MPPTGGWISSKATPWSPPNTERTTASDAAMPERAHDERLTACASRRSRIRRQSRLARRGRRRLRSDAKERAVYSDGDTVGARTDRDMQARREADRDERRGRASRRACRAKQAVVVSVAGLTGGSCHAVVRHRSRPELGVVEIRHLDELAVLGAGPMDRLREVGVRRYGRYREPAGEGGHRRQVQAATARRRLQSCCT
jgi:hypothetical protein